MVMMCASSSIHKTVKDVWITHFQGKMWTSVAANVIGVVFLLTFYVFLFGLQSLKKFETKDVITITHEEESTNFAPSGITPAKNRSNCLALILAITIFTYNPLSGKGWKGGSNFPYSMALDNFCKDMFGDKLIKCVEENTFMANDILVSDSYRFKPLYKDSKIDELFDADSIQSVDVQVHYLDNSNRMAHVLYPEPGVISQRIFSSFHLTLNNTFTYDILISDPKLMFTTTRHGSFPTTLIPLEKGSGIKVLFIKVVKHSISL